MKAAVITFPGSNCDRDMRVALKLTLGTEPLALWHADSELPSGLDLVVLPGGFSYGDYLRSGALAARSSLVRLLKGFAERGGYVLGVCNGFQILTEAGLLPGALTRNAGGTFICRDVRLRAEAKGTPYYKADLPEALTLPVAHHDGNYFADAETLARLNGEGLIAFRYDEPLNGSCESTAGVYGYGRRVLGMMPHPERAVDPLAGGTDGLRIFTSLLSA